MGVNNPGREHLADRVAKLTADLAMAVRERDALMAMTIEQMEAMEDGVYAWMSDRPISTHDALSDGVAKAFKNWLESNGDQIIESIASKVAKHVSTEGNQ
jgi:uncharacterized protein YllA (UPF0747 family)